MEDLYEILRDAISDCSKQELLDAANLCELKCKEDEELSNAQLVVGAFKEILLFEMLKTEETRREKGGCNNGK